MEWVETTGRTVEEAKEAALDQLGVDETDAEFVMVSEPRAGLFGRMRGEARVRARVRPTSPRPKRTRTRRPGEQREGGARRSGGSGPGAAAGPGVVALPWRWPITDGDTDGGDALPARRRPANGSERSAGQEAPVAGLESGAGRGQGAPAGTGPRRSRLGEGATLDRSTSASRRRRVPAVRVDEGGGCGRDHDTRGAGGLGTGVRGRSHRRGLGLERPGVGGARRRGDGRGRGRGPGRLPVSSSGPGGATLAALRSPGPDLRPEAHRGPEQPDRGRRCGLPGQRLRSAALQKFTRQIAEEVSAAGAERALEPMSAADRKVVHDTINEIGGLATRSEGEEPRRYIVISPVGPHHGHRRGPADVDDEAEAAGG